MMKLVLILFIQLLNFSTFSLESVTENGAYSGLTWFIQISDVHISFKHPERTKDFREFVSKYLKIYNPDLVLCSGDLTDAKIKRGMSSEQVESEWQDYYQSIMTRPSGVPWLDIRGNHDNLNVQNRNSSQNFYRNFSSMGREGNLESYKYTKSIRGKKYNFVALDATLDVGTRFPFNFIGDFSEDQQKRIKQLVGDLNEEEATIFFGHYPSSTVRQKQFLLDTVSGGRVYLCGHLHDLYFRMHNMYSMHGDETLELELVDWKWNRAYRLLAVDQGYLSHVDVRFGQWPIILPTLPKNSEFLLKTKEPDFDFSKNSEIRTLVFSDVEIKTVTCYINGGSGMTGKMEGKGPLFTCPWNPNNYRIGLHKLKIVAEDTKGRIQTVEHSFTLDKTAAIPFNHFLPSIILGISFSTIFQILYGGSVLLSISFLPLLNLMSKLITQRRLPDLLHRIFHYLVHTCCLRKCLNVTSVKVLFYFFTLYPAFLAVGPWVVGRLVEDSYGAQFAWGTYVDNKVVYNQVGYFKYALQTLFIHPVIILICGHILECRAYSSGERRARCNSMLTHVMMTVLFLAAGYVFLFESIIFWLQFGVLGFILGVITTWGLLFYSAALFWSFRVSKSSVYTNVIVEDHSKKTDGEED